MLGAVGFLACLMFALLVCSGFAQAQLTPWLGLAGSLLITLDTLRQVDRTKRQHPLWGKDPLYPLLLGLNATLALAYPLALAGLGLLLFGLTELLTRPDPLLLGLSALALAPLGYGLPWAVAAFSRHLDPEPPQPDDFAVAGESERVCGLEVSAEGQLFVVWDKNRDRWRGEPNAYSEADGRVRLPVRGIRLPANRREKSLLWALSRAVVWRTYGTKRRNRIHALPLYRLADGGEDTEPYVLVKTRYGKWQQRSTGERYASLAELLVGWGLAVPYNTQTSADLPEVFHGEAFSPFLSREEDDRVRRRELMRGLLLLVVLGLWLLWRGGFLQL